RLAAPRRWAGWSLGLIDSRSWPPLHRRRAQPVDGVEAARSHLRHLQRKSANTANRASAAAGMLPIAQLSRSAAVHGVQVFGVEHVQIAPVGGHSDMVGQLLSLL